MLVDPLAPFNVDVFADDGFVDPVKLAVALDLTLSQVAAILGVIQSKLTESPTSPTVQAPASKLLESLNGLAVHLGVKRYVRYWLRTPRGELGNHSPLYWLERGKLEEICDHVERMVSLQPD